MTQPWLGSGEDWLNSGYMGRAQLSWLSEEPGCGDERKWRAIKPVLSWGIWVDGISMYHGNHDKWTRGQEGFGSGIVDIVRER